MVSEKGVERAPVLTARLISIVLITYEHDFADNDFIAWIRGLGDMPWIFVVCMVPTGLIFLLKRSYWSLA